MDIHKAIETLQQELGYKVSPIGSCQGFSLRWLEACFLKEENIFDARISKIVNELDTIAAAINKAQVKPIKERTPKDMQLLEIPAFYVSLGLYQMPEEYASLFGEVYHQPEVKRISALASSEKIFALGGLDEIVSDIYYQDEFKKYLDSLEQLIKRCDLSSEDTIGLALSTANHTNALTYTPGYGWKFMDINTYPSQIFPAGSTSELIRRIHEDFAIVSGSIPIAISATVFTVGLQEEKNQSLKTSLGLLKEEHSKSRAIPEPEKAIYLAELAAIKGDAALITQLYTNSSLSTKNSDGLTMHYLAAKNGHANVIDVLGSLGVDLKEANENGATAVFIAAVYNHDQVIKKLSSYEANLNAFYEQQTPLYVATYYGHFEAVKALVEGGADLDLAFSEDISPPIFVAVEKKQIEVLAYLIHSGANVNLMHEDATPLFLAVILDNIEAVQQLINAGDINLDISCLDSIDDLYDFAQLVGNEATSRAVNFIQTQSDPNDIKVTAGDIAQIKGNDEIAKLIKHEQDKRANQNLLIQQNSFCFFEEQHSSLMKRKRQSSVEKEANKSLKVDGESSSQTSPGL
ncbi:ankyrin repeat domain-containing protein [Legionella rowbothamii]|uniref:ankyrin repeat domain-containing protein n=1 Tax=Legionella rowbothamii TaxID=96229 RepID=UPI001055C069|nr:ankyrin repeat domain-containing protein [Legionella rowbothamii]